MEREREIRLSHAAEESMEKAYAFKASPEGQKAVAGIGDFAISCGDINVLAQEMLICRIKTLEELRPLSTEDLQFAFNEFTFKALNAMAARERGVVLDWDEVKEKRKIEYESFASKPDRHGGMDSTNGGYFRQKQLYLAISRNQSHSLHKRPHNTYSGP